LCPDIIREIKSIRMRWEVHLASIDEKFIQNLGWETYREETNPKT